MALLQNLSIGEIVSRVGAVLLYAWLQGLLLAGLARLLGDRRPLHDGRLSPNPFAQLSVWGVAVGALVLGCTHYPLLKDVIRQTVGPRVVLVDSAEATAQATAALLAERGLLATPGDVPPTHRYYVTDVPDRFTEVGARFLGRPIVGAEQVDITYV